MDCFIILMMVGVVVFSLIIMVNGSSRDINKENERLRQELHEQRLIIKRCYDRWAQE